MSSLLLSRVRLPSKIGSRRAATRIKVFTRLFHDDRVPDEQGSTLLIAAASEGATRGRALLVVDHNADVNAWLVGGLDRAHVGNTQVALLIALNFSLIAVPTPLE